MDTPDTLKISIVTALDQTTVVEESRYAQLNKVGFVRCVTAQEQWLTLVNDAWNATRLPKNDRVRDYLSFMLNRFMDRPDLYEKLSAFDYIRHILGVRDLDPVCIQDVADMSLQYVAFFSERSAYRHEPRSLKYSAELGEGLYAELARTTQGKDDWFSEAYQEMSKCFGQAVLILRSVCPRFMQQKAIQRAERDMYRFPDANVAQVVGQFSILYCKPEAGHG